MSNKVYEIVTEKILESLEKGTVPWHKPWSGGGLPMNLKSKKAYRGINVFMLALQGRSSRYWLSFKQAQGMGGQVRKGEKSTIVVFWKWLKVDDKTTGKEKTIPMLRYFNVFSLDQIDGIADPDKTEDREHKPIEAAEKVVTGMPNRPVIQHEEQRAFYSQAKDLVNMPKPESFDGPEEYYSTIFHELGHATKHESRLDRNNGAGRESYAQEELVAEMTSAFLCGVTGIESKTLDNSAAYIDTWRKRIKDDVRLVVMAGAQAQKASDFIQGIEHKDKKEE